MAAQQPVLVQKLLVRQGQQSDRAFARTLGVSVSRWCEVKAGQRPGLRFLQAVGRVYPDLTLEAAALLLPSDDSMLSDTDNAMVGGVPA